MAQNFKTIKGKFNKLSPIGKEELLKEIYDFLYEVFYETTGIPIG